MTADNSKPVFRITAFRHLPRDDGTAVIGHKIPAFGLKRKRILLIQADKPALLQKLGGIVYDVIHGRAFIDKLHKLFGFFSVYTFHISPIKIFCKD